MIRKTARERVHCYRIDQEGFVAKIVAQQDIFCLQALDLKFELIRKAISCEGLCREGEAEKKRKRDGEKEKFHKEQTITINGLLDLKKEYFAKKKKLFVN